MKITGVRTILYEIELTRLLGDANSPSGRRRAAQTAIFLDTDEGFTGIEEFGQRIAFVYGHGSFARFVVSTMKGNGET